jgi:hypothetical protein
VALQKPSDLFQSKNKNTDSENFPLVAGNFSETFERFKINLEKIEILSEQIVSVKEELSGKLTRTDLDNAMVSHLMILDENFKYIQDQVKGINKSDLREFKINVNKLTELVDGLLNEELPKYKSQVSSSELRVERRFENLEKEHSNKIEECIKSIHNYLEDLNIENYVSKHSIECVEDYISKNYSDLINLREELIEKIDNLSLDEINKKISTIQKQYNIIHEQVVLQEGLLNQPPETENSDPLTPLDQNFVTIDQLNDHYRIFINRVQEQLANIGGGGETKLKYLDDIVGIATNASAYDGKFLKYNHSIGKFEFVTVSGGTGGGGESYWASTSAGIHTLSNVGIGTTNPQAKFHSYGVDDTLSTVFGAPTNTLIEVKDDNPWSIAFRRTDLGPTADVAAAWVDNNKNFLIAIGLPDGGFRYSVGLHTEYVKLYAYDQEKFSTLGAGATVIGTLFSNQLNISGTSILQSTTFIGTGTSTGTASQNLQVTGGAYISGNTGIGTTNPRTKLEIDGTLGFSSNNVLIGNISTGSNLTTGIDNTIIGIDAGTNTVDGSYNTFLGRGAGYYNSMGDDNVAIGRSAGYGSTLGSYGHFNTFIGKNSGFSNYAGFANNFIGLNAGQFNTYGSYNNFFGQQAGNYNINGNYNNFFGFRAGHNNTSGWYNSAIGYGALHNANAYSNIALGHYAGTSVTTGGYNVFFGNYTGGYNYSLIGQYNTFIGHYSGGSTTGSYNIMVGRNSGGSGTSASYNVFLGDSSGTNNTVGESNVFVGRYSGYVSAYGNSNVFLGSYSGYYNENGSHNTLVGTNIGISTLASYRVIFGTGLNTTRTFDAPDTKKDKQFAVGINTTGISEYWLVGNENFNIGIGTTNPTSKLTVQNGDIKVGVNTSSGLILTSPNGTQFRLIVSDSGVLSTSAV